jgi:hypothetical protein
VVASGVRKPSNGLGILRFSSSDTMETAAPVAKDELLAAIECPDCRLADLTTLVVTRTSD